MAQWSQGEKNQLSKCNDECWLTLDLNVGEKGSEGGCDDCRQAGSILKGQLPFGSHWLLSEEYGPECQLLWIFTWCWLLGHATCGGMPARHLDGSTLALMLCCHCHKILNHFWTRVAAFSFWPRLPKWCGQSCFQKKLCIHTFLWYIPIFKYCQLIQILKGSEWYTFAS